jgi:sporulation protein YlmC with PRC-barrel domain
MTPGGRIKLVSELLDLPLVDSDGGYCGIVDDVEFSGNVKDLALKALLVGPGACQNRMPRLLWWLVRKVAGDRITRVPIDRVRTIGGAVKLDCAASTLGLQRSEDAAGQWIPRGGAL